ncbi:tRNA pseudouridine(55) synthase TruB [Corynebacterium caspium]|uniref:tRNA pseudouridine(55) synthase TruB n=1 Tax=Corynebacterium caspium TaxID=234828 RepID=UPI00039ECBA8|nr:tRNA pseudouridine(55) synthase TruB [Corynebacterium caspium]
MTTTPQSIIDRSGLIVIDKPAGLTSHDVVSVVRRAMGTKKVGHAGTLDPAATGVLVLGIERGTRFLAHLVTATKSYAATIRLGAATHTDDAEGETIFTATPATLAAVSAAQIAAEVAKLTGDIMQRPTAVSAIKINGKRAHELVRLGEKVDIPARPVTVSRFEVLSIDSDLSAGWIDLKVEVDCSSGTYIRALARDLGEALGVGGHLTALRRTKLGDFNSREALTLAQLKENPQLSLSLDEALIRCFPVLEVSASEGADLAMGKWLEPRGLHGVYAAVDPAGHAIALIQEKGKRLATIFVARPSTL